MSKLGKFLGSPEEIEIQGDDGMVKLMVYPLKVQDLKLFMGKEKASPEELLVLNREIIKKSLKDEEATDDEVDNMKTESYMKIMTAINKINGFEDEKSDKLTRLKERLVQQGK